MVHRWRRSLFGQETKGEIGNGHTTENQGKAKDLEDQSQQLTPSSANTREIHHGFV